jgi:hypothetical protein
MVSPMETVAFDLSYHGFLLGIYHIHSININKQPALAALRISK